MYHIIEFKKRGTLDVENLPKQRLEKLQIRPGTRMLVQLQPYVIETDEGPVEVADLFFADGTASRAVFFSGFSFVD